MEESKSCNKCNQVNFLSEFDINKKGLYGKYSHCRACKKTKQHHLKRNKFKYLKETYGIDEKDFWSFYENQNKKCAICLEEFEAISQQRKRQFEVDHCHSTGKVRGLLCHKCNLGIGNLNDDINLLKSAIKYLENVK